MDSVSRGNIPSNNSEPGGTLKRKIDSVDVGQPAKEQNIDEGRSGELQLKVLVPSSAAGAIIGEGAKNLSLITRVTGAKIRVSRQGDCYPGTLDRVCLLTGKLNSVKIALGKVLSIIREEAKVWAKKNREVKIIVPYSITGMVIGRGGENLRHIGEATGVTMTSFPNESSFLTQESIITITGDSEANSKACDMLLPIIQKDPNHIIGNMTYKPLGGPSTNGQAITYGYAQPSTLLIEVALNVSGSTRSDFSQDLNEYGFNDQAKLEIITALTTLSRHRLLNLGSKQLQYLYGNRGFGANQVPYWPYWI